MITYTDLFTMKYTFTSYICQKPLRHLTEKGRRIVIPILKLLQ
jgi:hypothetical protein